MNQVKNITNTIALIFITIMITSSNAKAEDQLFLHDIENVPLFPGLVKDEELSSFFDSPEGRIVEVYLEGTSSAKKIEEFYNNVLPELGWQKQDSGIFLLDDEILEINIEENESGVTIIKFLLHPHHES